MLRYYCSKILDFILLNIFVIDCLLFLARAHTLACMYVRAKTSSRARYAWYLYWRPTLIKNIFTQSNARTLLVL